MRIYTDGSCRRNGKPDCVSGFGVAVSDGFKKCGYETASTSQRGELYGMLYAIDYAVSKLEQGFTEDIYIVSDSAYITNCIRDEWYTKWERCGWVTSTGSEVKNIDIWRSIVVLLEKLDRDQVHFYLIKGHLKKTPEGIEEGLKKFAASNFGAVPPYDVFIKMINGNDAVDALAKRGRDWGELQPEWMVRDFGCEVISDTTAAREK